MMEVFAEDGIVTIKQEEPDSSERDAESPDDGIQLNGGQLYFYEIETILREIKWVLYFTQTFAKQFAISYLF